ncbi:MAG: Ni/Fe hydrogenase subunit alpha [Anaerolineales bacterium]
MPETIHVPALARVEGEGALYIGVKDGSVKEIRVDIYEPPRFFEGFLRGRFLQDVPDITARICGICPVAYQMSSVRALEAALNVQVTPRVRLLRNLFYCGEWIESHVLHIFMLQGPDLTGHESALSLAQVAPDVVKDALRMKKIGNQILRVIGGRSVHPVNACVGGWYRWPEAAELRALLPELEWGLERACAAVGWAKDLPFPQLDIDYEFMAMHRKDEYAILDGDILSSLNGVIDVEDFGQQYLEKHMRHSNALHSYNLEGKPYLVGPLARLNLNHEYLGERAALALKQSGIRLPLRNPYKSLLARAIETVEVFERAIHLIGRYVPKGPSAEQLVLRPGHGAAATEAPRGLLYHRYNLDADGLVEQAKIVPPTAQNLARMEADLWQLAPQLLALPHDEATLTAEHLLRAYDPCISCATHFVKLKVYDAEG